MYDVHLSETESARKQSAVPVVTPELDEAVWLAWKEKNRAKDRIWSAHGRRLLMVLVALAVIALIAAYSAGAIA